MNYYPIIYLILSNNQDISLKDLSSQYYNDFPDKIKYFYVELKPDLEEDVIEFENYIYIKGEESVKPGLYYKTTIAMKYVNNKYKYDFLVKTTIDSFWNVNNIISLLDNSPKENYVSGYLPEDTYISRKSLIITKEICESLVRGYLNWDDSDENLITYILKKYDITNIDKSQVCLIDNQIPDNINDFLYFDINNSDISIYQNLLRLIYNKP